MSRIGKMPVAIPAGVEVTVADGNLVTVKGPKGTLTQQLQPSMTIKQEGAELLVSRPDDGKENRALHGLTRALLHNMVVGVTDGYKKTLEVNGVGYRAAKEGNKLSGLDRRRRRAEHRLLPHSGSPRDRRHHHRGPPAQPDRRFWLRQAEGRSVCR